MKEMFMLISQQKITPQIGDFLSLFRRENLEILFKYLPQKNHYWVGSGREALKQILSHLSVKNGLKKVGIPAFTCHVVLEAVKRAGGEVVFYDSGIVSSVEEIKKIIKEVQVLVVSYNFGFLPKIDEIALLCRQNNVILIEDCAQALGAKYKGKLVGSFGDYAFYSFGISKNIGFTGAIIGTDSSLNLSGLKEYPFSKLMKVVLEGFLGRIFFNRFFYSLTHYFLRGELSKEQEGLAYACPKMVRKIVLAQMRRYEKILELRKKNGEYCLRELAGKVNFVQPLENSNPSWLYFTLLVEEREKFLQSLLNERVELGEMKTFRCLDGKSTLALEAEKKHLTFALYRSAREVKMIVEKIKKVCA